jgi:hypothetical protein
MVVSILSVIVGGRAGGEVGVSENEGAMSVGYFPSSFYE